MNPRYIGISVIEFNERESFQILHKKVFDLSELTCDGFERGYGSNKRKHEIIQIAHDIANLVDYWKCDSVAIEELSMESGDKKKGKTFNRLCNNVWNRKTFVQKLKSLSLLCNFRIVEVNPAYSSFIGNIVHGNETTPDMVAASIEIARRSYRKFQKGWMYPIFNVEALDERWKQTLCGAVDWMDAFKKSKESGLRYRSLLSNCVGNAVFSQFYRKKRTFVH